MDPLTSLLVLLAVLTLTVALFWPSTGLAWRWRRGLVASDRVEVEDALKHLWDGEYRQRSAGRSKYTNLGRLAANMTDLWGVMWLRSRARLPGGADEL